MKNKVTQHKRIYDLLQSGLEIDMRHTPFTSKLSTRLGETLEMYNIDVDRDWKKLSPDTKAVRTYRLKE